MKKFYTLASAVLFTAASFAQVGSKAPKTQLYKATLDAKTKAFMQSKSASNKKVAAAGPFDIDIDPIEQVMTQKGIDLTSTTPQDDIFITGLYQDSTVLFSSPSSARPINDIFLGSVMDPKSLFLDASLEPIVSKIDSYTLDSLFILGSYIKKTPAVDTLYTWVVWGDTTNTTVFTKMLSTNVWVAPISGWRKSLIGPKVTGATAAAGNKVKAAAPASNMRLIKYVLTNADSTYTAGRIKVKSISTGTTPITIPAGNVVSAFFTFVPGGTYTVSDCSYNLGGSTPQNVNGFAAAIWSQASPALTSVNDYQSYQVDATSMTMGTTYDNKQRHAAYSATYNNNILGIPMSAPVMYYSIQGVSSVGINELESTGLAVLGQNVPNPYSSKSVVPYQLTKEASNVTLTVTDVMGRVISSEVAPSTTGKHSVSLGSYASGVYYYTLTVDGKSATKKMIVQ